MIKLFKKNIPQHVGIIPDGNRRWARSKGLTEIEGYSKISAEKIFGLIKESKTLGIKFLSFWIFSTENWGRERKEIDFLFSHFLNNLENFKKKSKENNVKILHIGRQDRLPKSVVDGLKDLENTTRNNKGMCVLICMDYGGRDEIIRAVNKAVKAGRNVDEKSFAKLLDTSLIPDVDLIIRTSGENRLSGFMPFQSAYSELAFLKKPFPEFASEDLRKVVEIYSKRQRRFGK